MKAPDMSRRDRRAVSAGAATIVLVLVIVKAAPAFNVWATEARASDMEWRAELRRDRAIIARSAVTRDSTLARGRRVIALAPALLAGDSPGAAGASLASLLSGAAAQSNVRLGVVQLRSDTLSHAEFTRVGAHLDATGDVGGIVRLLSSLERGPTLLAIRSLAITQPDVAAGDDRIEALHLELDVEGLMLNPKRAK